MSALALVLAASCGQGFAPPTDRTLDVVTTDRRGSGEALATFRQVRSLRFVRASDGYEATLILRRVDTDAPAAAAAGFRAGTAPFVDIPLRYRVSGDGCTVEPLDAEIARALIRKAGEAMAAAAPDAAAAALRRRAMEGLAGLDEQRWRALLASTLTPLLPAAIDPRPGPATRTASSPLGGTLVLSGSRQVTRRAGSMLIETRLESEPDDGTAATTIAGRLGQAAIRDDGATTMTLSQTSDMRTGMVMRSATDTRTRARSGGREAVMTIRSTTLIEGLGSARSAGPGR